MAFASETATHVQDVYSDQCAAALQDISDLLVKYPYVAMDTEFPGTLFHFNQIEGSDSQDRLYWHMVCNTNHSKLIQIGISLFDALGKRSQTTWQFNLKFDWQTDCQNKKSVQFLKSHGIQFQKIINEGIRPLDFGCLFKKSKLVSNPNLKWITYQGAYDFAYLFKLITDRNDWPASYLDFKNELRSFFPVVCDMKYVQFVVGPMVSHRLYIRQEGLNSLAKDLNIPINESALHQAGHDSLITGQVYFSLKEHIRIIVFHVFPDPATSVDLSYKFYGLDDDETIEKHIVTIGKVVIDPENIVMPDIPAGWRTILQRPMSVNKNSADNRN